MFMSKLEHISSAVFLHFTSDILNLKLFYYIFKKIPDKPSLY